MLLTVDAPDSVKNGLGIDNGDGVCDVGGAGHVPAAETRSLLRPHLSFFETPPGRPVCCRNTSASCPSTAGAAVRLTTSASSGKWSRVLVARCGEQRARPAGQQSAAPENLVPVAVVRRSGHG